MRFKIHYTREEARALLPRIRDWLDRLTELRKIIEEKDELMASRLLEGCDLGGPEVNEWVVHLAEMKELLLEFYRREIQIKDLDRGLIDFPAIREDEEVFLCWEKGESDILFWHDLDAGFSGREPL